MMGETLHDLLVWWSDKTGEPIPLDPESIHSILDRLGSIGILTPEEVEQYKKVDVKNLVQ